jgi:hypothetical protein
MSDPIEYALGHAPTDVADTLRWVAAEGFRLRHESGGSSEAFGNVLLEFERAGVRVMIVRDRSQWMIDIAAPEHKPHGLQVWLTAMRGKKPVPIEDRSPGATLPEQLPEGECWRSEVPAVIAWIAGANRAVEINAASEEWRRVALESFATLRARSPSAADARVEAAKRLARERHQRRAKRRT